MVKTAVDSLDPENGRCPRCGIPKREHSPWELEYCEALGPTYTTAGGTNTNASGIITYQLNIPEEQSAEELAASRNKAVIEVSWLDGGLPEEEIIYLIQEHTKSLLNDLVAHHTKGAAMNTVFITKK